MMLIDVAMMLVDGGEAIGDINVLSHQGQMLGPVASAPTVSLDELTTATLQWIQVAKARTRRHVWKQLPALLASQVADTDLGKVVVLDADATLVTPHSEKGPVPPHSRVVLGTANSEPFRLRDPREPLSSRRVFTAAVRSNAEQSVVVPSTVIAV